jgi:hypothetical protein
MKRFITITIMMWCCALTWAQRHIVYSDDIRTLQVVAGVKWQELPVIKLNGAERINISFDELSHEYHRYTYSVVHLEKDWTESTELLPSDYINGFQSGLTIDNFEESINTTQDYTHYKLQIPNQNCRLKMSGNYRVDVIDESNGDERVLSAYFMVNEDMMNTGLKASGDTDIDLRRSHQQVMVKTDYSPLKPTDARQQITGYILQNYRWESMKELPLPTSYNQQYMEWDHCRDLIFEGGNEYHKFEILDIHRNSFNVEENIWDRENEIWHTYVWADYKRPSYVYDEVPKGAFLIRNSDNREANITSEYVITHFTLQTPEPFPYPLYVEGMWGSARMTYNPEQKAYTGEVPLKYGYYSYQYIMRKPDGSWAIPPTEGSFFETRNTYTVLFYYRGNTDRTDRLVSVATLKMR